MRLQKSLYVLTGLVALVDMFEDMLPVEARLCACVPLLPAFTSGLFSLVVLAVF